MVVDLGRVELVIKPETLIGQPVVDIIGYRSSR